MTNTKNGQLLDDYWAIIGRLFSYCSNELGNLDNYFKKNPHARTRSIIKINYIFLYITAQIVQIAQSVEYQSFTTGQLLKPIVQIAQKLHTQPFPPFFLA